MVGHFALPPELRIMIYQQVVLDPPPRDKWAGYASLGIDFQNVFEHLNFASLALDQYALSEFAEIVQNKLARRMHVREISFRPKLPYYESGDASNTSEDDAKLQANNRLFEPPLRHLLDMLSTWSRKDKPEGISLEVEACSLEMAEDGSDSNLCQAGVRKSRRDPEHQPLPSVDIVSSLVVRDEYYHLTFPWAILMLLQSLPSVSTWSYTITSGSDEEPSSADLSLGFPAGLTEQVFTRHLPSSLRNIRLFRKSYPEPGNVPGPTYHYKFNFWMCNLGEDLAGHATHSQLLSLARWMCNLGAELSRHGTRLERLGLTYYVDASQFFRGCESFAREQADQGINVCWNLKYLSLTSCAMVRTKDLKKDYNLILQISPRDPNQLRRRRLLTRVADVVLRHMPNLEAMELWETGGFSSLIFCFYYKTVAGEDGRQQRQPCMTTAGTFTPNLGDVPQLWQGILTATQPEARPLEVKHIRIASIDTPLDLWKHSPVPSGVRMDEAAEAKLWEDPSSYYDDDTNAD